MAILLNILKPILFTTSSSFKSIQLNYFFKQTYIADAKFLRDLDKFLATNLKPDIFTVLVKTTRLIETSVTRLLLGAFWLLKMNINWVGLKSSNYGITGHQTCKKATELAQDYCSFHNMLMIPL